MIRDYYAPPCPTCQRRNGLRAAPSESRRAECLHCRTPLVTAWTWNEETNEWTVWWDEDASKAVTV